MNGPGPVNPSKGSARWGVSEHPFRLPAAVGLVGLVVTIAISAALWNLSSREAEQRLESQVKSGVDLTSTALSTVDAKLVSLSGLFRASVFVTPGEFDRFTSDVGVEDGMIGIGYIVTVEPDGLDAAQSLLTSQNGADITAFEFDSAGMPTDLGSRDIYHLIQHVFPREEWRYIVGLDAGSLPDVQQDLRGAIDTGRVAMTRFLPLPGEDEDTFLMLRSVAHPVTDDQQALVVALMDFSDLLKRHIPASISPYLDWQFSELETAAPVNTGGGSAVLAFGGREWLITVVPTSDSPFGPDRRGAFGVFVLGLIATALAVLTVHLIRQRVADAADLAAARQATDAKVRFIASISHELRTPLTAVLGFAEILKDGNELSPEERYSMMKAITEEATDLAHIIDDLLVAARGEIGQVSVAKVPISLRDEVQAVVAASGLVQRVSVSPPAVESEVALGDPSRVRQILRNLLENARRYGGTNIEIGISANPGRLSVEVRDDGSGVPDSILSRLFEPYQHAGAEVGVTESLGLGLNVSSQLAALMDGALVHQRMDGWTVFTLTLPAAPPPGSLEVKNYAIPRESSSG